MSSRILQQMLRIAHGRIDFFAMTELAKEREMHMREHDEERKIEHGKVGFSSPADQVLAGVCELMTDLLDTMKCAADPGEERFIESVNNAMDTVIDFRDTQVKYMRETEGGILFTIGDTSDPWNRAYEMARRDDPAYAETIRDSLDELREKALADIEGLCA